MIKFLYSKKSTDSPFLVSVFIWLPALNGSVDAVIFGVQMRYTTLSIAVAHRISSS